MTRYGDTVSVHKTPQTEKVRGKNQVTNSAGGAVFDVGPWQMLDRFLILGQVGPTYYAAEHKIVRENAKNVEACLQLDGPRTVARIVEISDSGRAPKNDPAIFALALAASCADDHTRKLALDVVPRVCRTGTHLFHFVADVTQQRNWGRGLRTAIGNWYKAKSNDALAMQAIKYQSRDGWSHRDLLRLAHPTANDRVQNATFRWMITGGGPGLWTNRKNGPGVSAEHVHPLLEAYDEVHATKDLKTVLRLIEQHNLPREAIPTEWLNEPGVWQALLPHMGITALIRNLGKMTSVGVLKPLSSAATKHVVGQLTNEEVLRKGRVHPMQLLVAQGVYMQGHGDKGKLSWTPNQAVVDGIHDGFYAAFKTVEPTGKNTLIALDISGSMDGGTVAGAAGITPRAAAAAMAMVTARLEKNWHMVGFTATSPYRHRESNADGITQINIGKDERLNTVMETMRRLPMGRTDCSQPMLYAMEKGLEVDVFQVYTDCETYAGAIHPFQALRQYRQKSGRDAKLIVVGLTGTKFTIADPSDAGMLDVVGMDSHAPALMADFARGEI